MKTPHLKFNLTSEHSPLPLELKKKYVCAECPKLTLSFILSLVKYIYFPELRFSTTKATGVGTGDDDGDAIGILHVDNIKISCDFITINKKVF